MKGVLKRHPEGWVLQLPEEAGRALGHSRVVHVEFQKDGLWIRPVREAVEELEPEGHTRGLDQD
ncbi:hypothetical protein [Deinococcus cellulosilyticus]|uniref:AbrB/MazE/SpoVT family DNA-binding domain-containing protein n=1 Tax=Deinococcus cellulosilyticus (strain DSM 18568 / NBRC 106333 / KACC 11606 / 5516J-15) TaxID=1223518 RepID=A0A511NA78_DEIC1|nr:hypothetical protein [Deinococcus cellulosilyticus]GEM49732.1 hypothetical protein DC3_53670 [Deinococcus cellulosilyticus NBRC 106333 = KACC 11606]